ncbi:Ribonuclease HII [Seminavis robusta]|uniref:Ribonuclease n=1 Tax=Seminavis robusta TaxID=568900 RepID=A0A9N8D4H6_9STRA|nr:Ribonuclease HII [Seminavis robusta]|eukprot:Sro2_g001830.1 Ribonuclease HII (274) ;mRNA; r:257374-258195
MLKMLPPSLLLLLLLFVWTSPLVQGLASSNNRRNKPLRKRRPQETLLIEEGLHKRGFPFVIGSDESGTGCIAGPIVTASCCITHLSSVVIPGVDDAKRLSKKQRNQIYQQILQNQSGIVWGVASRSNQVIDDVSLEQATKECFQESIDRVMQQIITGQDASKTNACMDDQFYCITDGHKSPKILLHDKISIPSRAWKGGDETVYSVALASIIARVHHESLLQEIVTPELRADYQFDRHKGYATREHLQALHTHGPSPIHRLSCKPVKDRLHNQ